MKSAALDELKYQISRVPSLSSFTSRNDIIKSVVRNGTIVCYGPELDDVFEAGAKMYDAGHYPKVHLPFPETLAVWTSVTGERIACMLVEKSSGIFFQFSSIHKEEGKEALLLPPAVFCYEGNGQFSEAIDPIMFSEKGREDEMRRAMDRHLELFAGFIYLIIGITELKDLSMVRPDMDVFLSKDRQRAREGGAVSVAYRTYLVNPLLAARLKGISKGGTHASPKWHRRIGHVRRLHDGKTTWVRACEVGDKARGMVIKDYVVGRDG